MFAFVLKPLRDMLERKLARSTRQATENGFLVVDHGRAQELTLTRMELAKDTRPVLGLFPRLEPRRIASIPLLDFVKKPLDASRLVLAGHLSEVPAQVVKTSAQKLRETNSAAILRAQKKVEAEAERTVAAFDEAHLRALLRSDRNAFRKKLLEELGKQAADVFAATARKHLAELVMRARSEATAEYDEEESRQEKNGLLALPTGTRFVVKKGKMTLFVIEQPPQTRTIRIMEDNGVRSSLYTLSLPYVVFFVTLRGRKSDNMYVFFRKEPLRSTHDELLSPNLPNMYEDFRVCFSPSSARETVAEMAEESLGNFWGGRFIETHDPSNRTNQISFESWKSHTAKDPFFGNSYQWRSAHRTVGKMIKEASSKFAEETVRQRQNGKNGAELIRALDRAVEEIGISIANRMKETCFNLVPGWTMDETVLAPVTAAFRETAATLSASLRQELGAPIDALFDDKTLHEALEEGVSKTLAALEANSDQPIAAARQVFLAQSTNASIAMKGGTYAVSARQ